MPFVKVYNLESEDVISQIKEAVTKTVARELNVLQSGVYFTLSHREHSLSVDSQVITAIEIEFWGGEEIMEKKFLDRFTEKIVTTFREVTATKKQEGREPFVIVKPYLLRQIGLWIP